ncbi:hypothetical protein TcG_05772 [Trypanosoma cruzi]|nr:hypothetical protein TcG_05772 [Trypanosoma cruzi]
MAFDAGMMEGALFPLGFLSCWSLVPASLRHRSLVVYALEAVVWGTTAFCVAVTPAASQHRLFVELFCVSFVGSLCGLCQLWIARASGAVGGRGKERTKKAMNNRFSFINCGFLCVCVLLFPSCCVRAEQNRITICAACRSLCRTVPPARGSRRDSAYGGENALNFSHRGICGPLTVRAASC